VTVNNQQGAMDLGILPDSLPGYVPAPEKGMNTREMLAAAARGDLGALWLVGVDLAADFYDRDLALRALEACPFVVVNELFMTETAQYADVVLPVQSVAERDGTFTNVERRVQRFWRAFEISPDIRPDWLVFAEIGAKLGGNPPYFSARDILRDVAAQVPIYRNMTHKALGDQGIRWEYPPSERPAPSLVAVEYEAPAAIV
jgi:NADH-quinone oxidoreductase subunit G